MTRTDIMLVLLLFFVAFANPQQEFRQGMWMLNGWALGNTTGLVGVQHEDVQTASFHQMNVGWNIVNAGLASYALANNKPVEPQKLEKIFWINSALDVVYVASGFWLRAEGQKRGNPQWIGWGESIMIQGGFLLVFDSVMGWRMGTYAHPKH